MPLSSRFATAARDWRRARRLAGQTGLASHGRRRRCRFRRCALVKGDGDVSNWGVVGLARYVGAQEAVANDAAEDQQRQKQEQKG